VLLVLGGGKLSNAANKRRCQGRNFRRTEGDYFHSEDAGRRTALFPLYQGLPPQGSVGLKPSHQAGSAGW